MHFFLRGSEIPAVVRLATFEKMGISCGLANFYIRSHEKVYLGKNGDT